MDSLKLFYTELSEIHHLKSTSQLLGWDQMVNMPRAASEARAEQMAVLEKTIYLRLTDPKLMELIEKLKGQKLSQIDQANLAEAEHDIVRLKKLPKEFVQQQALTASLSQMVWAEAKQSSDFERVKPHLEKLINLAKEEASLVGYKDHPYDALLDNYDPGLKTKEIKSLLLELAERLSPIALSIAENQRTKTRPELKVKFDRSSQESLNRWAATLIGYDFNRGRLDVSPHPFQSTISVNDNRITTRYDESDFCSSLYGTLHEAGHALYEQGLNPLYAGAALGSYCSMGMHESQSRFWENIIGRNRTFIELIYPEAKKQFPKFDCSLEQLYSHINWVEPTLIRVEADEVTYSLHVVIRMLLEEQLIAGTLTVKDLPAAWDELYQKYLGLKAPDLKSGVMQDIHWYGGSFGYFPSYVLGNVYGAILFEALQKELGKIEPIIKNRDFKGILNWLRVNVHSKGRTQTAKQIIVSCTHKELSVNPFINYIKDKYQTT